MNARPSAQANRPRARALASGCTQFYTKYYDVGSIDLLTQSAANPAAVTAHLNPSLKNNTVCAFIQSHPGTQAGLYLHFQEANPDIKAVTGQSLASFSPAFVNFNAASYMLVAGYFPASPKAIPVTVTCL
jgi:hypothetical protein